MKKMLLNCECLMQITFARSRSRSQRQSRRLFVRWLCAHWGSEKVTEPHAAGEGLYKPRVSQKAAAVQGGHVRDTISIFLKNKSEEWQPGCSVEALDLKVRSSLQLTFFSSYELLMFKVLADYSCCECITTSRSPKLSHAPKQRRN